MRLQRTLAAATLSPEQLAALRRELDTKLAPRARTKKSAPAIEETVFDLMDRTGLIGCLKSKPGSPTDLATNPAHMEGFGRG